MSVTSTPAPEDLGQAAARGAVVSVVGQAARCAIQVGGLMVLARLLSPADYGVVALGLVVVFLGEVLRDCGLSVVAAAVPTLSRGCRDGLWWVNVTLAVGVYALVLGVVTPISATLRAPGVAAVLPVLALSLVLQGCAAQYRVSLLRDLRFTALTVVDVVAAASGLGVAVWQASLGRGAWALVAQAVVTAAVGLLGVASATRWLPVAPSRSDVVTVLATGAPLMVSQLVAWIGKNADTAALGMAHPTAVVGGYSRAWNVVMMPLSLLRSPATQVAVPLLRGVRDYPDRFASAAARGLAALVYPVAVMTAVAVAAGESLVRVVLGDAWGFIALTLSVLAVGSLFDTAAFAGFWVCTVSARTRTLAWLSVVTTALRTVGIVAGLRWGASGVAAGIAVAALVSWPLSVWWTSRSARVPARPLFLVGVRAVAVCGVGSLVAGGCMMAARAFTMWGEVTLVAVAVGGVVLALAVVCATAHSVRTEVWGVLSQGWDAVRKRGTHGNSHTDGDQGGEQGGEQHVPSGVQQQHGVEPHRFAQENAAQSGADHDTSTSQRKQ